MGGGGRAIVLVGRVLPPTICPPQSYIPCRELRIRHTFARRSYSVGSPLAPPDVPRLAQTARITLTPQEVEEFAPKIRQVVDWFGQLQAADLHSVEPAIRADVGGVNLRDDAPTTFENRESMIAAVPCYEDPYIKVPKVLKTE